jgi:hypothetical protein
MLKLLIFFNKCAGNTVQMSGVYMGRLHTPGKLSFHLHIVAFSILAGTVVFLILFFLTDLFSLNLSTLFNGNVIYLAAPPFGKRAARHVRFNIPEDSDSSSEGTSVPNSTAPATAASAVSEAQDKLNTAWERSCLEVKASVQSRPAGSKPLGHDEIHREITIRYNQLIDPNYGRSPREILDIDAHVRKIELKVEARKADFKKRMGYSDIHMKRVLESEHLKAKSNEEARQLRLQQAEVARDLRLQQAADASAVRRFDFRSYLAKDNTARHYFAGATKPSRGASMHPEGTWPYDANNNYVDYKGPKGPLNSVDSAIPAESNTSFNDMGENEDPFIHKSASGEEEPPSEEGSPNIPGGGDNTPLFKKLIGFLLHLGPHWLDINTFHGKFLFVLFVIIGLILTMLGIRYLYYKFIKPLFNKNSKDSNKLKRKKDNNL